MNARRRREAVQRLIASLDPTRDYGVPFDQLIDAIDGGDVSIEEPRPGDPPVLTDRNGRLLKGSGQREGSFSPRSLALFSWGYPYWYVERQEDLHRILDHGSDSEKFSLIRAVLR